MRTEKLDAGGQALSFSKEVAVGLVRLGTSEWPIGGQQPPNNAALPPYLTQFTKTCNPGPNRNATLPPSSHQKLFIDPPAVCLGTNSLTQASLSHGTSPGSTPH